jgi:hypothetical protein
MDPLPPPDRTCQSDTPRQPWWFGFVFSLGLFSLSFVVNVCQREGQREEMRRQADEVRQIKAMLAERRGSL